MSQTSQTVSSSAAGASSRLPFVVPLLAVGTFLMCTTEYIVAGLLSQMSADLGVSLAQTGLLISAFAVGMVVGSPVMALATIRLPKRSTLVWALVIFALGHVLAALSTSFALVLIARVVTALVTGAFWSVASVVATNAAGPAASHRALGVMMSGVAFSTIAGVPLGAFAGQLVGWRGAFWALAVLALVIAVVIRRFAPADRQDETPIPAMAQLRALRHGRLWVMLLGTLFVTGGYMAVFSYVSPLLTERAGLPDWAVPLGLIGYGVGSLIGTNLAGRLAGRWPLRTFIAAALGAGIVMLLLVPLSSYPVTAIILIVLLGVTGMAVPPIATGLAVQYGADAPTIAAGLAVSAFNGGIALGAWIAGLTLDTALGAAGPALIGAIMAGLGLIPLLILTRMRTEPAASDAAEEH